VVEELTGAWREGWCVKHCSFIGPAPCPGAAPREVRGRDT